jgi:aldose 1-epimerase
LEINANSFTPLSDACVPTGEIRKVKGTDMDFNHPVKLSEVINSKYQQIHLVGGLDHNWVINKNEKELGFAARVSEPESGRAIEVYTTNPGVQVYTSMHFDGTQIGKNQMPFTQYCAIALEPQNFPDAPNHDNFPNCLLKPGETYHEKIVYKFKF